MACGLLRHYCQTIARTRFTLNPCQNSSRSLLASFASIHSTGVTDHYCNQRPRQDFRNYGTSNLLKFSSLFSTNRTSCRCTSTGSEKQPEYSVFYRFPNIRFCAVINRMKIYQTAFTFVIIPPSLYAYHLHYLEFNSVIVALGISTFACSMLYIMSGFFRHLIGLAAINKNGTLVRLSHMTFWGKRQDTVIPLEDFVPLMDVSENAGDIYVKIRRYSQPNESYYMTVKYGVITDIETFRKAFGGV